MKGNFSDPFIHPNPFSSFSAVPDPGPRRRSPRRGESARQETRRGPVAERASGVEAAAGMSDGNVGGAHSCPHHRRGWDWNSRLHQQSEPLRQPCPRTTGGIAGTFLHGSVLPGAHASSTSRLTTVRFKDRFNVICVPQTIQASTSEPMRTQ